MKIRRDSYLEQLVARKWNGMIKVIAGMRRSGKSYLLFMDVGQMDMYVRMYDALKRTEGDNPTLGIILCADTDSDIAKFSVLRGNEQLFASKYVLYLPSEEELRAEIESQKEIFLEQHHKESR